MDNEIITIELNNKIVTLNILAFDTDINVEDILKIDYNNIVGEILTFPVLLNRIMNLKAEMQNIVNHSKIDLEAFEAQLGEQKRRLLMANGSKVTVSEVDIAVKTDAHFIAKKKMYFEQVKNLEYLDALYWSAQSKSKLLEKISDKIKPSEFESELVYDTINGITIKHHNKVIK